MLELPDKKFEVTMTNVLKSLMEIQENMQMKELVSVEGIETIEKRQMGMLGLKKKKKHSIRDEKMLFMGSSVDSIQWKRESKNVINRSIRDLLTSMLLLLLSHFSRV